MVILVWISPLLSLILFDKFCLFANRTFCSEFDLGREVYEPTDRSGGGAAIAGDEDGESLTKCGC